MNFCKRFVLPFECRVNFAEPDLHAGLDHESDDYATREIRKHPKHMTDAAEVGSRRPQHSVEK